MRSQPTDIVVLIELTVRPEHQQTVIDTIRSAGDPGQVPGLRAITLLRGLDGTRVINHLRWTSHQAYEDARAHLTAISNTRAEVRRLVENATTNIYEVVNLLRSADGYSGKD